MMYHTGRVIFLVLLGIIPWAWAGVEDEIAEVRQQWVQALEAGNVEALTALFAEHAINIPVRTPLRQEGRAAIGEHFARTMRAFSLRAVKVRDPAVLVLNATTAIDTWYAESTVVERPGDRQGQEQQSAVRESFVWMKFEGRWRIVFHHASAAAPAS